MYELNVSNACNVSNVSNACIQVCPKNPANFNVDNIRVAKLLGGGLHNCTIVRGMVLKNDVVGFIKPVEKAKVVVYVDGVDTSATETKGTVLIHSAEQLENYAKIEEAKVEELIKAVVDSGAKVIVSGAVVGEMALHFCERYKLMLLKISSKFELLRFCRTTGVVALLGPPNPDDLGYVDSLSVEEIGGVTIMSNEGGGNSVCTVVLQGSTHGILDDIERAVDDGVNTYKAMCRDSHIVPGAVTTEIELARRLKEFSFKETWILRRIGLPKARISPRPGPNFLARGPARSDLNFGRNSRGLTWVGPSQIYTPTKTLAENVDLNAMEIISSLYAEHASGNTKVGSDFEEGVCKDVFYEYLGLACHQGSYFSLS
ncbi:hypothetical protein HYC85_009023 [Camellia sinensis]|uniref:Uncharacterized protein n=1 Tax=Camellia sinensis TaxID=4442 RepID=A0A7J7HUV0_CAMSI|nr:hypothetical protein HYC85_009023 [Camellia sinensis]